MSDFEKVLNELNELNLLAKSKAPDADDEKDDERIKAAADGDADDDGEPDSDDYGDDFDDDHEEPDGDEKPMKKSLKAWLEDGSEIEAFDGTAMMKSLQDSFDAYRNDTQAQLQQAAQAVAASTELLKSLHSEMREMRAQLAELGGQGRGRKSTLNVHEKPAMVPETQAAPTKSEVMAKAMSSLNAGRITGFDVARIEGYINGGRSIPADLLAKIS